MSTEKPYSMVRYHDDTQRLNVGVVSDRILFSGESAGYGSLVFLSVLGPHSAVRGILAAAATCRELHCDARPSARLFGVQGGRILTKALSKEVTHGAFLAPPLLLSSDPQEIAVLDDTPERVFARLCHSFALTALPEWAPWICERLRTAGRLTSLAGKGASGCLIRTSEEELDAIIGGGIRKGSIRF